MAKIIPVVCLTLAMLGFGCEAKSRFKLTDLKCVRCNEDGTNPEECDTVKEATTCNFPNKFYYMGCATIIGKGFDGQNVVTKSCAADCNQKGILRSGFGREVEDNECISLDKQQSEDAQEIWRNMRKFIQTNYEVIVEFCYCTDQACNEKPIGKSISGNMVSGAIRHRYLHFLCMAPVALAVIFGFRTQ